MIGHSVEVIGSNKYVKVFTTLYGSCYHVDQQKPWWPPTNHRQGRREYYQEWRSDNKGEDTILWTQECYSVQTSKLDNDGLFNTKTVMRCQRPEMELLCQLPKTIWFLDCHTLCLPTLSSLQNKAQNFIAKYLSFNSQIYFKVDLLIEPNTFVGVFFFLIVL